MWLADQSKVELPKWKDFYTNLTQKDCKYILHSIRFKSLGMKYVEWKKL